MTQALAAGYERILCCAEIDEARELAQREGPAVLAGERRLEHIEGFDFGNSPREVATGPRAPTLILSTTNGTRLLVDAASRFEHVYVGSLLSLDAVAAAPPAPGGGGAGPRAGGPRAAWPGRGRGGRPRAGGGRRSALRGRAGRVCARRRVLRRADRRGARRRPDGLRARGDPPRGHVRECPGGAVREPLRLEPPAARA